LKSFILQNNHHNPNQSHKTRAFTLLEVLLSFILFTGGVLALFPVVQSSQKASHALWQRYRAMIVAENHLQHLLHVPLSPGHSEHLIEEDGASYTITFRVTPNERRLKTIRLKVRYGKGQSEGEVNLATIHYETK